jgi:hypothetical protein
MCTEVEIMVVTGVEAATITGLIIAGHRIVAVTAADEEPTENQIEVGVGVVTAETAETTDTVDRLGTTHRNRTTALVSRFMGTALTIQNMLWLARQVRDFKC